MTESHDAATLSTPATPVPTAGDLPLLSYHPVASSPLVRFGGFMGIAGVTLGFLIMLAGCAGFGGAMSFSPGPVVLGGLGVPIVLAGAFAQRRRIGEDSHVMQALFACLMALFGGLIELEVAHGVMSKISHFLSHRFNA